MALNPVRGALLWRAACQRTVSASAHYMPSSGRTIILLHTDILAAGALECVYVCVCVRWVRRRGYSAESPQRFNDLI